MTIELTELRKLPIAEKLHLVEQLWDDIHASDEPLVLQDWHQAVAERRAAELEANPSIAITREELWRRVEQPDG